MNTVITSAQTAKWAFLMAMRETYRVVNVYDAQALIDKDQEERKIFLVSLRSATGEIAAVEVDLNDAGWMRSVLTALKSDVVMGIAVKRFPSSWDYRSPPVDWWASIGTKTLALACKRKGDVS